MSVDYDKQADYCADIWPKEYAHCVELFEKYDADAINMVASGHTDPSILAIMPFWYRKWKRNKGPSRMTRSQKISKLANAVRAYRGLYRADSKQWIQRPQSSAGERVKTWLERLHLDVTENLKKIDAFGSLPEFRNWLNSLE